MNLYIFKFNNEKLKLNLNIFKKSKIINLYNKNISKNILIYNILFLFKS